MTIREAEVGHPGTKYVIVNADDFGASAGVNRGVVEAHEHGIVTSATLMVRGAAAPEAAELAREHPRLSIGLHVDLGEWAYRDGEWTPVYEVVPLKDCEAVTAELERQLSAFFDLMERQPTHLDSHQHVHREEPTATILAAVGRKLGVPVRHQHPLISYRGDFYGQTGKGEPYPQAVTVAALVVLLTSLPPGVTELGCHPGYGDWIDTTYRVERELELQALCDPMVREAATTAGIELKSFDDLLAAW